MLDALHIVVPMAVHEVGDTTASSFRQVAGVLLDDLVEGNAFEDNNLLAIGRKLKALDLAVGLRQLLAVCAVGLHAPDFTTADEGDGLVIDPSGIGLAFLAGA